MQIDNILKSFLHFFIAIYWIFIFYWQSKNYETIIYDIPYIIKIGIPFSIKDFCYQDINGEFSGKIIDILNTIFIKKLNINIEYVCTQNNNEFCHCILNISKKQNSKKLWLHSNSILDHIPLLKIQYNNNNNNNNNNNIVALKNDVLFLFNEKKKNYIFLDSIEEIIIFLEINADYYLLISEIYYNDIKKTILKKNNIKNYTIKKIKKKINFINLLFHNTLYWLIIFFNIILHKLKKDQNEL